MNNSIVYVITQIYKDVAGEGGGFLKCAATATANIVKYLNVEQRAHWLPIQERTYQQCHVIKMSLCHTELYLSDCTI